MEMMQMQEQMQAKNLIEEKSQALKKTLGDYKFVYSVAIDTDDDGNILSERYVIRKNEKANVVTTLALDHKNGDFTVEINNGFNAKWNVVDMPITHDERLFNVIVWSKASFLLPMSMINDIADETHSQIEIVKAKHADVMKRIEQTQSYIDSYEQPLKDVYAKLRIDMEVYGNTPVEERSILNPNQAYVCILGALIEHAKYENDPADEVDFWEKQIADLAKQRNALQKKEVALNWIKFETLKVYPICKLGSTLQYFIKLFDNTQSYFDRANVEYFVKHASQLAYIRGIVTKRQKDVYFEKMARKMESPWQRDYRVFHDDERLQEGLQRAMADGYIHPNQVPVCPSGRQRNELKKIVNKFLEINDGVSLYEKVNGISPKLIGDAQQKAEQLIEQDLNKANAILDKLKAKKTTKKNQTVEPTTKKIDAENKSYDDILAMLKNL
jgi:hypothetical protein